jgi:hypothetical protein
MVGDRILRWGPRIDREPIEYGPVLDGGPTSGCDAHHHGSQSFPLREAGDSVSVSVALMISPGPCS